jgi:DNA-binding FadR family transcriptional regulator
MSQDRLASPSLPMTHELVAAMLGVRRESVTQAAQALQAAGAIEYRRGHITILDRATLEERVGDGYAVVKQIYQRLLQTKPAAGVVNVVRAAAA